LHEASNSKTGNTMAAVILLNLPKNGGKKNVLIIVKI
jgi:hypothetical protein